MNRIFKIVLLALCGCNLFGFKIDRVILSSDANPFYLDFWPLVARSWIKIGIRPTLALIADKSVTVDQSLGDVIRFDPIDGVPVGKHAQMIRPLLPAYFPNDICLISDIDMLALNKSYFCDSVKDVPADHFVVYRDKAYPPQAQKFPMCYNAAKGSTFKEIFAIDDVAHIPQIIKRWFNAAQNWDADEKIFYAYIVQWKDFATRCTLLGHDVEKRIDRSDWRYDTNLVRAGYYIDSHMVRPYSTYKMHIDQLAQCAGI